MVLLGFAVTCAILAPAGPQKARLLAILHRDPRSVKLDHYDVLDKMYLGKIIKRPDVKAFEDSLQIHQKLCDGIDLLDKALKEHNIEVISKIY